MTNMNNNHRHQEPAFGISLADLYFILFRHKRAIVLLTLLGLIAAAVYFFTKEPPFQSNAMLLIKYISEDRDRQSQPGEGAQGRVKETTDLGQGVIMAEAKILKSFDLFAQVVTNIGAEKILAKAGGGTSPIRAAILIQEGLAIVPGKEDGVIDLTFSHPEDKMVVPILQEIVRNYIDMSSRVHSQIGASATILSDQVNSLHIQISNIDDEIRNAKTNANIVDVEPAKRALQERMERIQAELDQREIEMVGSESLSAARKSATNDPSASAAPEPTPLAVVKRYKLVVSQLSFYQHKEDDFFFKFGYTESNKLVLENRENLNAVAKTKNELEEKYPALADLVFQTLDTPATPNNSTAPVVVRDLSPARVDMLQKQLALAQAKVSKLDDAEAKITELTRKRTNLDNQYKNLTATIDAANYKELIGPGHISNINQFQSPTPPFKNRTKFWKAIGGMILGGLMAGLAWAFLFEFYIDRTVKRASEVETKLNIPFFLAIPAIGKSNQKQLSGPSRRQLEFNGGPAKNGDLTPAPLDLNSAVVNHALDQHYDALRDRLVTYFESINLTRKPKLVAITSAGRGAGVSTIASGLAASLSETGDGRVLLVDMNQENGSAQQFFHGKANCKLDDALSRDKRDEALVSERLYVVSEGSASDKLSRVLPKRFAALVPQLKASDYDYIIFDMPPVSQTSVTTRLAGFMDSVMLVIESEKTERDAVQQASALLSHSKANVTAVLNKTQQHVPMKLVHDINARG